MIYSCTLFYNEIDLLNIKVDEELAGGVDKVIVCESSRSFQNNEKPLLLKNWTHLYVDIIEIGKEFDNIKFHENPSIRAFRREAIQRNIPQLNYTFKKDDIIICADVDEIFTREDIPKIAEAVKKHGFIHLVLRHFYYKLNLMNRTYWTAPCAFSGKLCEEFTFNELRMRPWFKFFTNGKHFSYLTTADKIIDKLKNFSHSWIASQPPSENYIKECIDRKEDFLKRGFVQLVPVHIDETYPKMDLKKWEGYIIPANQRIKDIQMNLIDLYPSRIDEETENFCKLVNLSAKN